MNSEGAGGGTNMGAGMTWSAEGSWLRTSTEARTGDTWEWWPMGELFLETGIFAAIKGEQSSGRCSSSEDLPSARASSCGRGTPSCRTSFCGRFFCRGRCLSCRGLSCHTRPCTCLPLLLSVDALPYHFYMIPLSFASFSARTRAASFRCVA